MRYELHVSYTLDDYVIVDARTEEEAYEEVEDELPPYAENIDVISIKKVFHDDD